MQKIFYRIFNCCGIRSIRSCSYQTMPAIHKRLMILNTDLRQKKTDNVILFTSSKQCWSFFLRAREKEWYRHRTSHQNFNSITASHYSANSSYKHNNSLKKEKRAGANETERKKKMCIAFVSYFSLW